MKTIFSINKIQHLVAATFCVLFIASNSFATNYYVNDGSTVGDVFTGWAVGANYSVTQDGKSISKPVNKLKILLTTYAASFTSGDTIFINTGNYTFTGSSENNMSSPINGVVIQGAGANKTIITNSCADCYFMYINDNNTVINDLTLSNYNDQTGGHGQALGFLTGVTGVIVNNVVVNKSSTSSSGSDFPIIVESGASVTFNGGGSTCNQWDAGGGIHVIGATTVVKINNYQFIGGYNLFASPSSSGLWVENGIVTVKNCLFDGNETDASTYSGTHLSITAGNVTVLDCKFINSLTYYTGAASVTGGAICIMAGTVRIARSIISNHASSGGGGTSHGGGIGIRGGTVTIDSCLFSNNFGSTRGRDFYNNGGTVTVRDCTFGATTNQIGCASGTTNINYSGSPASNASYRTGLTLTVNAPRYTPNPITPIYSGTCATAVLLPVELIDFDINCEGTKNVLTWKTASERNNNYFIIEKGSDNLDFKFMTKLTSEGNSLGERKYEFEDYETSTELSYYRLSQVDYDGNRTILQTKVFSNDCKQTKSSCFYNALNKQIDIHAQFENNEIYNISLVNTLGQTINSADFIAKNFQNIYNLDINQEVSNQLFFINIKSKNQQESIKVIKL